jgi:hypothetical protein
MTSIVEQLKAIAIRIDTERPFVFFAVILREGATDWDLLVAASWLQLGNRQSHEEISRIVRGALRQKHLVELGRIIMLDPNDKALAELLVKYSCDPQEPEYVPHELQHTLFSGVRAELGYVLIARSTAAARAASRKIAGAA